MENDDGFFSSLGNLRREDVVMYALLAILTLMVGYIERVDIKCPTFSSTEEQCENGGGMSFSFTKPNDQDTCEELIKKIYKSAGAEQASIKWRRSFVLAVIIAASIWVLTSKLPSWKILYTSVLIAYVIIFANFNYYSYHIFGKAETWMKDAIKEMEDKGCLKH